LAGSLGISKKLNMYHQQWQSDQQKQIIANMADKCQISQTTVKEKTVREILTITIVVAAAVTRATMMEEDADAMEEAEEAAVEEAITPPTI
jgi:Pyruvate/2-oxoacid:ferredoxin oxidoreductase gamma subunit